MKEKLKNFLLKIKNYFTDKFVCNRIKLIAFAFIVIFVTCLCNIVTFTFKDHCFNETHTSQIVESPQAEFVRIEREIKGANPTHNDYVNPNYVYNNLYFNEINENNFLEFYGLMSQYGISTIPGVFYYVPYCLDVNGAYVYIAMTAMNVESNQVAIIYYVIESTDVSSPLVVINSYFNGVNNAYTQYINIFEIGVPQTDFSSGGIIIDVGEYNQYFYNFISSVSFDIAGGYEDGFNAGYDAGKVDGFFEGEEYGYNNGYTNGLNEGFDNGFLEGEEYGYYNGYGVGYTDGKNAGISITNPLNPIMDFIADGASVISNVFSFEILPNISLGTMLLFPLAIALIWFVIKLFMGG